MSSGFGVGSAHFRTGNSEGYVDTVAFGAYRKEVFTTVGLFDEKLVRNQDDELNYRVTRGGFKIWLTHKSRLKYYVRSSFKNLFNQYFQYGYWKVYVNKKHRAITTFRQLVPALFVFSFFFGALLSFFYSGLFFLFTGVMSVYFLSATFAALKNANNFRDFSETFLSFLILHFSYGTGYLKAVLNILILQRNP